jgi:hydrogenase maturation protease
MKREDLDKLVEAVLYEGHILYPYRASSKKNQQRFTFGRVYPEAYSRSQLGAEPAAMQTQCLARAISAGSAANVEVCFLQPMAREIGILETPLSVWVSREPEPTYRLVSTVTINGRLYQAWHEAMERRIRMEFPLEGQSLSVPFEFPAERSIEPIHGEDGRIPAAIIRRGHDIRGEINVSACDAGNGLRRLTVRIENRSEMPEGRLADAGTALLRTFASAHTILRASNAEFLSVTSPPPEAESANRECRNIGTWPVLVGDEALQEKNTVLSSPIVLPDYPQVAPESPGTLFDGTEIDEILTLRILTMTDEEKLEMRNIDRQARALLERTESLQPEHLISMHGVMKRSASFDDVVFGGSTPSQTAKVNGREVRVGDAVIIRPKSRADVMDVALAGRRAVIEAIEQDAEGGIHLALVVEDDPGRDLGMLRQPGHRFFYGIDEVELPDPGKETP